jgi:hypothetical protein
MQNIESLSYTKQLLQRPKNMVGIVQIRFMVLPELC